jgi:molybdopterin molybdotransferase
MRWRHSWPRCDSNGVNSERLTAGEVMRRLVSELPVLPVSRVALLPDAAGRIAGATVRSRIDVPMVRNSAMDGYAVVASDVRGASTAHPAVLRVIGQSAAGTSLDGLTTVESGTAMRVATGAPVPPGADAVIRIEDTDRGVDTVQVTGDRDLSGSANLRAAGDDWSRGAPIVERGDVLDAFRIAQLAAVGEAYTLVVEQPRVAILSSGDELVAADAFESVLSGGGSRQVASSTYALRAMVSESGGVVSSHTIVPDDRETMTSTLRQIVDDDVHLILSTGGISVGERDLTREIIGTLGGTVAGWRIAIRPGGPFGFGRVGGARWLGLPGNPVSTLVTFLLFGAPLIRALGGDRAPWARRLRVQLAEPIRIGVPFTHFIRARIESDASGTLLATPTGPQGSHLLTSMLDADVLVIVPPDQTEIAAGTLLWAIPCSAAARGATEPPL